MIQHIVRIGNSRFYCISFSSMFFTNKIHKTYASMCNANGVPIDFIREQLGHASLSATYGYIYNPLTEAESFKMLTGALSRKKDTTPDAASNVVSLETFRSSKTTVPKCPQMSTFFKCNKIAEAFENQSFRYK